MLTCERAVRHQGMPHSSDIPTTPDRQADAALVLPHDYRQVDGELVSFVEHSYAAHGGATARAGHDHLVLHVGIGTRATRSFAVEPIVSTRVDDMPSGGIVVAIRAIARASRHRAAGIARPGRPAATGSSALGWIGVGAESGLE